MLVFGECRTLELQQYFQFLILFSNITFFNIILKNIKELYVYKRKCLITKKLHKTRMGQKKS